MNPVDIDYTRFLEDLDDETKREIEESLPPDVKGKLDDIFRRQLEEVLLLQSRLASQVREHLAIQGQLATQRSSRRQIRNYPSLAGDYCAGDATASNLAGDHAPRVVDDLRPYDWNENRVDGITKDQIEDRNVQRRGGGRTGMDLFKYYLMLTLGYMSSTVGLMVAVFIYILIGAFIFQSLESTSYPKDTQNVSDYYDNCIQQILPATRVAKGYYYFYWYTYGNSSGDASEVNLTTIREDNGYTNSSLFDELKTDLDALGSSDQKLNKSAYLEVIYNDFWLKQTWPVFKNFSSQLVYCSGEGWDGEENSVCKDKSNKWAIVPSFLFAMTIVTTIGYGNIPPKTVAGRWMVIVYAIIGIPLTVTCLTQIGQLLGTLFMTGWYYVGKGFSLCWAKIKKKPDKTAEEEEYEKENKPDDSREDVRVPLIVSVLIILIWIILGAVLFSQLTTEGQDWNGMEAFYFSFITLSTIGFGDYVYGDTHDINVLYLLPTCLYLVAGLSILSMCFDLMHLELRKQMEEIGRLLGMTAEEDETPESSIVEDFDDETSTELTPSSDVSTNPSSKGSKSSVVDAKKGHGHAQGGQGHPGTSIDSPREPSPASPSQKPSRSWWPFGGGGGGSTTSLKE